jgi:hypothetical protein
MRIVGYTHIANTKIILFFTFAKFFATILIIFWTFKQIYFKKLNNCLGNGADRLGCARLPAQDQDLVRGNITAFGKVLTAIGGGSERILLLKKFNKMGGVGKGTLITNLRDRFRGRDEQQTRLQEALLNEPTMWR